MHVATPISDHSLVVFTLRAKKPAPAVHQHRAWRQLSLQDFASDLAASKLCTNLDAFSNTTVDEMVQLYRTVTTELLDKHCPVVNVCRRARPKTPWLDAECRSERRRVRVADEVAKLVGAAPCKTCSLDLIPTWLVKEMRGLLSPFISLLFQKSFSTGLPTEFKEAIVRPLLKKSGIDSTQKKNYPFQICLSCPNYWREQLSLG